MEPLSVAPMLDVTDRHFRFLLRLITRRTRLYTEMIVANSLARDGAGDFARAALAHDDDGGPLAAQLGGCDPDALEAAAALCVERGGYDEINLNCGCPSPRFCGGGAGGAADGAAPTGEEYGARLMLDPACAARAVRAIRRRVGHAARVSVKCRLGVAPSADAAAAGADAPSYAALRAFVAEVERAGADAVVLHARAAVLEGLSTAQNRTVPPLRPARAHALKRDFAGLRVVLNGGVATLDAAAAHLRAPWSGAEDGEAGDLPAVDGVMIGRAVWHQPWMLRDADARFFGAAPSGGAGAGAGAARAAPVSRREVCERYLDYAEARRADDDADATCDALLARPLFYLFAGERGARAFRRALNDATSSQRKRAAGGACGGHEGASLRERVQGALDAAGVPDDDADATRAAAPVLRYDAPD